MVRSDYLTYEVLMRKRIVRLISICILLLLAAAVSSSGEQLKCALCGMLVDETAPFSAKIDKGKQAPHLHFCDIGDLLLYLREKRSGPANAFVRDYRSGEWIDAARAFYVHAPQRFTTPMGWSIAAFRERAVAVEYGVPEDLTAVSKRVGQ